MGKTNAPKRKGSLTEFRRNYKRSKGEVVKEPGGVVFSQHTKDGQVKTSYHSDVVRTTDRVKKDETPNTTTLESVSKKKVGGTKTPSKTMKEFSDNWAQHLLDAMYMSEHNEEFGLPCSLCSSAEVEGSNVDESNKMKEKKKGLYRCSECFQCPVMCKECIIKAHKFNPFHRLEMWTGTYLKKQSLFDLGFVLYLGHYGEPCSKASSPVEMTVVHTTGIQTSLVAYCECTNPHIVQNNLEEKQLPIQLLRYNLFAASYKRPQTVFSTHVLKHFYQLSMQAKITAHDYVKGLRRLSSNGFTIDTKDRYREFLTASRRFNFLRLLRWNGKKANRNRAPGSLAVRCVACPQPDVNMDPDWDKCKDELMYIHMMSYSKDSNFQQGQHAKKMDKDDVPLTKGAAYYADEDNFPEYLKGRRGTEADAETTTCSNFKAMSNQYRGKAVSGIVSLTCSRHGIILPSGTVDLQNGERFSHVDYATVKGLETWKGFPFIISSYDINCQYGKNFIQRLSNWMDVSILPVFRRCVPKYHLLGHKDDCRFYHSFKYMPGTGITDGEAPERRWAADNLTSRSTREMMSGHRHDTLTWHNGDFNVQKDFTMGIIRKNYPEYIELSGNM